MLITDLRSVYVTHLFVICKLLAMSSLCFSSASRLLYISNVKYKYSTCWGDCPSVWISSWILPANSPLSSSASSAFWQLRPLSASVTLSLSPPKYKDAGIARAQHIHWSQILNTSASPLPVIDNPLYLSLLVSEFVGGTGSDTSMTHMQSSPLKFSWHSSTLRRQLITRYAQASMCTSLALNSPCFIKWSSFSQTLLVSRPLSTTCA